MSNNKIDNLSNEMKVFLKWADKYIRTARFEYVCLRCYKTSMDKLKCCNACKEYLLRERTISKWASLASNGSSKLESPESLLEAIEWKGALFTTAEGEILPKAGLIKEGDKVLGCTKWFGAYDVVEAWNDHYNEWMSMERVI